MISTKNVNAKDRTKPTGLKIVTTKTIDASIKTIPKENWKENKNPMISTHNIEDVAAIAAKKIRDEIQAEKLEQEKEKKKNAYQKKLDAQKRMAKARIAKKKKTATVRFVGDEPKMERHSIEEKKK